MPAGNDPPLGILSSPVFDAINVLTYNATAKAFSDGTNTIYLFIEKSSTSELPQWNYGTAAQANAKFNPRGEISVATSNIFLNGTYNSGDSSVTYMGKKYKFRLERDANGVDQVKAVVVT